MTNYIILRSALADDAGQTGIPILGREWIGLDITFSGGIRELGTGKERDWHFRQRIRLNILATPLWGQRVGGRSLSSPSTPAALSHNPNFMALRQNATGWSVVIQKQTKVQVVEANLITNPPPVQIEVRVCL